MPINACMQPGDHIRITRTLRGIPDVNDSMTATITEGTMGQVMAIHHDFQANTSIIHTDIVGSPDRNTFWKIPADAVERLKRV